MAIPCKFNLTLVFQLSLSYAEKRPVQDGCGHRPYEAIAYISSASQDKG